MESENKEKETKSTESENKGKRKISVEEINYIISKVDEDFYKKHVRPVVSFIRKKQDQHNIEDIESAYRKQMWREEFETVFNLIYEALDRKK